MTDQSDGLVTGNPLRVRGTPNPIGRLLVRRFEETVAELWERASADSMLDVGCGEGVLTLRFAERLGHGRVVGLDLPDRRLRHEWSTRRRPNLEFQTGDAAALPFSDAEFELVAAIEVLEHLSDPCAALAEMARVSRRYLLVSVPREPLWRLLNVARGAYWRRLGNTPGHLHHWTKASFAQLLETYGAVERLRSPLPWTVALVATKEA